MDGFLDRIGPAELRQLFDYWHELRRERIAPRRRDLDPTRIPRLLSRLMILDLLPDGRLRYRLTGTEIEHFFGGRMTGRTLDEVTSGEYRSFLEEMFRTVIEEAVPVYSENTYADRNLRTYRLLLPLSEDGERISAVLAGQVFERGRGPSRPLAYGHGPIADVEVVIAHEEARARPA